MAKQTKTARLLKSMKSRPEIKTPIATDMFLPNPSGVESFNKLGRMQNWDITNLKADHIAEKTAGHDIVLDNDLTSTHTGQFATVCTDIITSVADEIDPPIADTLILGVNQNFKDIYSTSFIASNIKPSATVLNVGASASPVTFFASGGEPVISTPLGTNLDLNIRADGTGTVTIESIIFNGAVITTAGGTINLDNNNIITTGDITASDILSTSEYWFDSIGGNTYITHGGPGGGVFTLANRDGKAAMNLWNDTNSITVLDLPAGAASNNDDSILVLGRAEFNYELFGAASDNQNPKFSIAGYPTGNSLDTAALQIVDYGTDNALSISTSAPVMLLDNNVVSTGSIASATTTITASSDALDVSGVNTVFINITGDIILGGLVGGVDGQIVNFAIIGNFVNHCRFEHAEGIVDSQDFINHTGLDEDIDHGGCVYVCNGTNWYDISHARHV